MKKIVMNSVPEETRMAVLDEGELVEMAVERSDHMHLVGNIYKGRVQNVLPGMQAAFVDIGCDKNAFLYIGDGLPKDAIQSMSATERFHVGQSVVIQIVKDSIGSKGPRATTHITLPGRYVVLMPTVDYVGISRRIDSASERDRLKQIAGEICPKEMGIIVRTVAANKSEVLLKQDMTYLVKLWQSLLARSKVTNAPALLYRDADMPIRIVRDYFSDEVDEMVVDSVDVYQRICDLLKYASPELVERVKLHSSSRDIFQVYGLQDEIENMGKRMVELKSGGFIVIDKTEALTVVDVNTGKFVGETNLSDTVLQTNLEAAKEIAKQIRLRDIGGIIVIDFIDMGTESHKHEVLGLLTETVKQDKVKTNVVDITPLGLVEITRKKSRRNFEGIMYSTCPCCEGRGMVESPETIGIKISRQLRRMEAKKHASNGYVIQVHAKVAEAFGQSRWAMNLEWEFSCRIRVEKVAGMHPEAYAVISLCRS